MITGIVDVGGGMRGVYAAGVLDYCLEAGIRFDVGIGVSAGSANIASYIAGQKGRNYRFYTEYSFRKAYMSARNLVRRGSYLDLDYIYGTLSNSDGENPLDYRRIADSHTAFYVVATDARTGEAKYFEKTDLHQDDYSVLKASSAIPVVCRPYSVEGIPYFDGALGDAVPIEKAFQLGCDRVVLVLTKPRDALRTPENDRRFARIIEKEYPAAAEKLRRRAQQYNWGLTLARAYEAQGKVLIVAPDDIGRMKTLTRDTGTLKQLYDKGRRDAKAIPEYINH